MITTILGSELRDARLRAGFETVEELASWVHFSAAFLSGVENAEFVARPRTLVSIRGAIKSAANRREWAARRAQAEEPIIVACDDPHCVNADHDATVGEPREFKHLADAGVAHRPTDHWTITLDRWETDITPRGAHRSTDWRVNVYCARRLSPDSTATFASALQWAGTECRRLNDARAQRGHA